MAGSEGAPQAAASGLDEREQRFYQRYHVERWTMQKIADAEDPPISVQRVSQIMAGLREKMPPVDLAALRERSIQLHLDVIRRAYEMAGMKGAPVTAGKDGDVVYDPEGGEVVRDYALRGSSLALVLKAEAELRKLLGLDAATKVETSGTVRYEVVGVDPADLT